MFVKTKCKHSTRQNGAQTVIQLFQTDIKIITEYLRSGDYKIISEYGKSIRSRFNTWPNVRVKLI
jgi:hypothetical protein